MEFNIAKNNPEPGKYKQDDVDLALQFAKRMHKEFGDLIKAIVLFGSNTKQQPQDELGEGAKPKPGDIDLLVVVDDVSVALTSELVETYRIIAQKAVMDISPRIHLTSLKLSSFWGYIRAGDPVGLNMLREGVALLDSGFFEPLRALLKRGMIRPSPESIFTYFARAPRTLENSKWHIMQASVDLYWAVIDAAHSALMTLDEVPPSPEHVADMMEERLVKPGLLNKKYVATVSNFYKIYKGVTRREIQEITGKQFDELFKEAEEFVNAMKGFLNSRPGKTKV